MSSQHRSIDDYNDPESIPTAVGDSNESNQDQKTADESKKDGEGRRKRPSKKSSLQRHPHYKAKLSRVYLDHYTARYRSCYKTIHIQSITCALTIMELFLVTFLLGGTVYFLIRRQETLIVDNNNYLAINSGSKSDGDDMPALATGVGGAPSGKEAADSVIKATSASGNQSLIAGALAICTQKLIPTRDSPCPMASFKNDVTAISYYVGLILECIWLFSIIMLLVGLYRMATVLLLPHLILQCFVIIYCSLYISFIVWNYVHIKNAEHASRQVIALNSHQSDGSSPKITATSSSTSLMTWSNFQPSFYHIIPNIGIMAYEAVMFYPIVKCYQWLRDIENDFG